MVKRLTAWQARAGMAPGDALDHWRTSHAALVAEVPGVTRYVQNHCIAGPDDDALASRPYDGLGEVWFGTFASARAAMATPQWRAVLEDAAGFMDLDRITAAWAEEHVLRS